MKRLYILLILAIVLAIVRAVYVWAQPPLTIQDVLNQVRVDSNGAAISVIETSQDAFNAVYDATNQALRIRAANKAVCLALVESSDSIAVGDGTIAFAVPAEMNGLYLYSALAAVHTKGVTGSTTIQVRRRRAGSDADMLTTPITLGDVFSASSTDVTAANKDLATGDLIYVDVDTIHTTAPKGLSVTLTFK
ncbi:MAG: hypothetical protein AB1641_09960 [Thermodesulfobacteriota bacterium]